jgi:putative PIN family toxin of toxin-antitoxin system
MSAMAGIASRVIFDTSTLISAALRQGSTPWEALTLALRFCEVCASRHTMDELWDVVRRERFDPYLPRIEREKFVRELERGMRFFEVGEHREHAPGTPCRDQKDQKFLDLAFEADADMIVSSDEDLLVLDPWHGIRILRPAQFVERMMGQG